MKFQKRVDSLLVQLAARALVLVSPIGTENVNGTVRAKSATITGNHSAVVIEDNMVDRAENSECMLAT